MAVIPRSELARLIDDKQGVLESLSAKEANAIIRYALKRGMSRFAGTRIKKRFTRQVLKSPWRYRGDRRTPMVDSGHMRDKMLGGMSVKSTSTGRGKKMSVALTLPGTQYSNTSPSNNSFGIKSRERRTYAAIIRTMSPAEKAMIVKEAADVLAKHMGRLDRRVIQRGKNAGKERVTLSGQSRKVAGI